jgi:hypothetical protein
MALLAKLILHSERQYKRKIEQMKLKRNVEASKRLPVIQRIQYRKDILGKSTEYVRIHGHRKTQEMIQQWIKQYSIPRWTQNCPRPSCTAFPISDDQKLRILKHFQVRSVCEPSLTLRHRDVHRLLQ